MLLISHSNESAGSWGVSASAVLDETPDRVQRRTVLAHFRVAGAGEVLGPDGILHHLPQRVREAAVHHNIPAPVQLRALASVPQAAARAAVQGVESVDEERSGIRGVHRRRVCNCALEYRRGVHLPIGDTVWSKAVKMHKLRLKLFPAAGKREAAARGPHHRIKTAGRRIIQHELAPGCSGRVQLYPAAEEA